MRIAHGDAGNGKRALLAQVNRYVHYLLAGKVYRDFGGPQMWFSHVHFNFYRLVVLVKDQLGTNKAGARS